MSNTAAAAMAMPMMEAVDIADGGLGGTVSLVVEFDALEGGSMAWIFGT